MEISLEISMYPLNAEYKTPIQSFIDHLNHFDVEVKTNAMSTQLFGPFDQVMEAFTQSLKKSFIDESKVVVVTKFFNKNLVK